MSAVMPLVVLIITQYEIIHLKMMLVKECFLILKKPLTRHPFTLGTRVTQADTDLAEKLLSTRRFKATPTFMVLSCMPSFIQRLIGRKRDDEKYFNSGIKKIKRSLDLVTFLNTQRRLKVLEHSIFNSRQKQLARINQNYYLQESTSHSSTKCLGNSAQLVGYKLQGTLDQRLLKLLTPVNKKIVLKSNRRT